MLAAAEPDLFLGVFPAWVGDLLSILGAPAILLAIVVWVLGRRDANRRLEVDEGTLKKTEFDSFTAAQTTALEDARNEADKANDRLDIMDDLYDQMRDSINWLRGFVKKITASGTYSLTADEKVEFEKTKPPARPPRRRV